MVRSILDVDPDSPDLLAHYAEQIGRMISHFAERPAGATGPAS
jgi:hypothetical protein